MSGKSPLLPFPGPRAWDPCGGAWGRREADTACPQPSSSSSPLSGAGGREEGKVSEKGGKFQEPGLEQKKESCFFFLSSTNLHPRGGFKKKKKKPEPTHGKRRLGPGRGKTWRRS